MGLLAGVGLGVAFEVMLTDKGLFAMVAPPLTISEVSLDV